LVNSNDPTNGIQCVGNVLGAKGGKGKGQIGVKQALINLAGREGYLHAALTYQEFFDEARQRSSKDEESFEEDGRSNKDELEARQRQTLVRGMLVRQCGRF